MLTSYIETMNNCCHVQCATYMYGQNNIYKTVLVSIQTKCPPLDIKPGYCFGYGMCIIKRTSSVTTRRYGKMYLHH